MSPGDDVITWITKEFDLEKLDKISAWLWMAGRPVPPHPLHHQRFINRSIYVVERMDLHLVWTTGRIFLKPLPRFLLEPDFWSSGLACIENCVCPNGERVFGCMNQARRSALGFLFSYAALVSHEIDFDIAKQNFLLPPEVTWTGWQQFVREIINHVGDLSQIHRRFVYGELRQSRVDRICNFGRLSFVAYLGVSLTDFFQSNFTWLTSATVYIVVVLTAMQLGLATKPLADNDNFHFVSYGFAVFSILGPLAAIVVFVLVYLYYAVNELLVLSTYNKRRMMDLAMAGSLMV